MRYAYTLLLSTSLLFSTACSTMNESLQLGAGMGAATGAAATYAGQHSAGKHKGQDVALGAAIGLGVGLITSYFTHKEVEKDRESYRSNQIEMHFGDLPPSPFLIPQYKKKGGPVVKLRKQVVFVEEAWAAVDGLTKAANEGFNLGHINYSDTINAMILSSKASIDTLRAKHTDVRRTLKSWASKKEVDIDSLIKDLTDIKSKATKRRSISSKKEGV